MKMEPIRKKTVHIMKYRINETITFDESKQMLVTDENTVPLSHACTRLLSILIEKEKTLVRREVLLEKVWGESGKVVSNHNLNQNISLLRKKLNEVGLENAIETHPKQGFLFTCDSVSILDAESADNNHTVSISRFLDYKHYIIITILCAFLAFLIMNNYSRKNDFYLKETETCAFLIDKLRDADGVVHSSVTKYDSILKNCVTGKDIAFYDYINLGNNSNVESIFSFCKQKGDNYDCENHIDIHHN